MGVYLKEQSHQDKGELHVPDRFQLETRCCVQQIKDVSAHKVKHSIITWLLVKRKKNSTQANRTELENVREK